MKKDLIIISAGKFGREMFSWATDAVEDGAPWRIKGFLDDRPDALDGYDYEARILGNTDEYHVQPNDVFIGAIGDPQEKLKYYSSIANRGGKFVNLIHPLANIGKNVELGGGVIMTPYSQVTCDAMIGNFVSIGSFSNVGHNAVVGDWSQISSHCGINGNAYLGEGVFLGSHSCVIPDTRIEDWAYVGAGSVVLQGVEPYMKVFGNPAVSIGRVDRAGL